MYPFKGTGLFIVPVLTISLYYTRFWDYNWAIQFYPIAFQAISALVFIFAAAVAIKNGGVIRINVLDILVTSFYGYGFILSYFRTGNLQYRSELFTLISYLLVYFALRLLLTSKQSRVSLLYILLISLLLHSSFAYYELIVEKNLDFRHKVSGAFTNSGLFGGFVSILSPVTLYFLSHSISSKKNIIINSIFSVVCFSLVIISGSRAAVVAVLVANTTAIILLYRVHIWRFRKSLVVAIALLLPCLMLFLYQLRPASADGRLLIWKVSTKMIGSRTVLGEGLGYFNNEYNLFQSNYLSSQDATSEEKLLAGYVHSVFNEYLGILLEFGVLGVLFITGILAFVIKQLLAEKCERGMYAFGAGILAFYSFALFSYPMQIPAIHVLLPIFLAAFSSFQKKAVLKLPSKIILLSGITLSLCILIYNFNAVNAVRRWKSANAAMYYNLSYSLVSYEGLRSEMKNSYTFLYNYGSELADLGYYAKALDIYKELNVFHHNIHLYCQMGRCYEALKQFHAAESCYKIAMYMEPIKLNTKLLLFKMYRDKGFPMKATAMAKQILITPIKIPTREAELIRSDVRLYLMDNERR